MFLNKVLGIFFFVCCCCCIFEKCMQRLDCFFLMCKASVKIFNSSMSTVNPTSQMLRWYCLFLSLFLFWFDDDKIWEILFEFSCFFNLLFLFVFGGSAFALTSFWVFFCSSYWRVSRVFDRDGGEWFLFLTVKVQ